jgi:hypothetical protein
MLDTSKLENVRERNGKTTAACPACREAGHDRSGEHLVLFEDGKFGCVAYPGDDAEARNHRKSVFRLSGVQSKRAAQTVKSEPIKCAFSPIIGALDPSETSETQILGRFGRSFQTYAHTRARVHVKSPEQPSEASGNWQDVVETARRLFNAEIIPDDDLDLEMRERLHMIEVILCQRDHQGRISYTGTQIEACAIGLRRHAGTHPDVDAMLHRLNEAAALALGWRELERRWRG